MFKSEVWTYFETISGTNQIHKGQNCQLEVKYTENSMKMERHLNHPHPGVIIEKAAKANIEVKMQRWTQCLKQRFLYHPGGLKSITVPRQSGQK